MLHVLKTWHFEALHCIGTEDLGRVLGCVEGCCFLSQTWAGHSVYKKCFFFFLRILLCEFYFCDICHLGDGAVQKECTLVWGIHFICLRTSFRKHENHKNYNDTFYCTWIVSIDMLWILSCLKLSLRWLVFLFLFFQRRRNIVTHFCPVFI